MRIALVHYSALPVLAGVELVMAAHARLFREAGHEVTIVCGAGEGEHVFQIEEMRAQKSGSSGSVPRRTLKEKLRRALEPHQVVFLHNVMTMHFHPALLGILWELIDELPGVRFISWIHDIAAANPDYAAEIAREDTGRLLSKAHPRADYIAVSELRRRQFLDLAGQPPARCRTIPNGVNPTEILELPSRIAHLAERHSLFDRDFLLLQPARLLRRKNVELTLNVAAALKSSGHSCATFITAIPEIHHGASAAYADSIREMRKNLKVEDEVFFAGDECPLDNRELAALFRIADALFFPSRHEGFGLPVLEAALHRLPAFCSDIEPLNTLLPQRTVTFPLDAPPREIATLISSAINADPAFTAKKETLRTYSWAAIYRNFLAPLLAESETV